jgi:hypothetical protein
LCAQELITLQQLVSPAQEEDTHTGKSAEFSERQLS